MGLVLRSIFYYIKESVNIEKHFEDKTKVRICFVLVFAFALLANFVLQYVRQVFAADVNMQNINVILQNITVVLEQSGDLNKFFALVMENSAEFNQYLFAFLFNNIWMIIISLVVPFVVFVASMVVIVKYLISLVIELRRKSVKETFVKTYFSEEYVESESDISKKLIKNIWKYILLFVCVYIVLQLFASSGSILASIINVILTRIMYFTLCFSICFKDTFSQALGKGIKVFGFGFFRITVDLLIFALLAEILRNMLFSFGGLLNYKEAIVVIGSFVVTLLTFIEAKIYFYVFADVYCGIPKKEEVIEE